MSLCLLDKVDLRTKGSLDVRFLYLTPDAPAVPYSHQKYLSPVSFLVPIDLALLWSLHDILHCFLKYYESSNHFPR